jgi:hypothetical protein
MKLLNSKSEDSVELINTIKRRARLLTRLLRRKRTFEVQLCLGSLCLDVVGEPLLQINPHRRLGHFFVRALCRVVPCTVANRARHRCRPARAKGAADGVRSTAVHSNITGGHSTVTTVTTLPAQFDDQHKGPWAKKGSDDHLSGENEAADSLTVTRDRPSETPTKPSHTPQC